MDIAESVINDLEELTRQVSLVFTDDEAQELLRKIPHNAETLGNEIADAFLLPAYANVAGIIQSGESLDSRKIECKWEVGHWLDGIKRSRKSA